MELISRKDLIKYLKTYYPQYAVIIGVLQTQVPTIESRPKGEWIDNYSARNEEGFCRYER